MALGRLVERDQAATYGSRADAVRAAGGLWAAAHPAIRTAEVLEEAHERGVRALVLSDLTEDLATQLPDLEVLVLTDPDADVRHLRGLDRLRLLNVDVWRGELDLGWFPRLEWLALEEPTDAQVGAVIESARRHRSSRDLVLGRYPFADLGPLADIPLRRLSISRARRLQSLGGSGELGRILAGLELSGCPALPGLDEIEAFGTLQALAVADLRQVTTLDWVARLPALRFLSVSDLRGVESLAPLADHPALEFVMVGPTRDLDLSPLARLPALRLAWIGGGRWRPAPSEFPQVKDRDLDDPDLRALRELQHG